MAKFGSIDYITSGLKAVAREYNLDFDYETYPGIGDMYDANAKFTFKHPLYEEPLIFAYNSSYTRTEDEFISVCFNTIKKEWFTVEEEVEKKNNFRDELVERIKAAGQDLVDRADSFVAKDMKYICDFNININFSHDGPINISIVTDTISTNEIEKLDSAVVE